MTSLLQRILPDLEPDLARGAIATITRAGTRIRDLPLG